MPQQQFNGEIPIDNPLMEGILKEEDNMIQDAEIVEEITENISGNDPSKKVCSVCGQPAFCQSKDGQVYLCEKHYIQLMKKQKRMERHTPIIRQEPKVGRNDLCPCGSGKKYKKCCMNKDQ